MRKVLGMVLAVMLLAAPGFYAMDKESGMDRMGGPDGMGGPEGMRSPGIDRVFKMRDELKLTDDQVKKLDAIQSASKREIADLHHEIMKLVWDVQDEMKKENADKTKVLDTTDKISGLQAKIMRKHAENMFEVKSILTKEQFDKLSMMLEHKKETRKGKLFGKEK